MARNQKQWQFLRKTAELGKTPHALLFYGEMACNKKALALDFIKLLNCENKDFAARPCNRCRACQDIEKLVHPDLAVIGPAEQKEIKISQIRDLQNNLSFRAYSAPFKAAIIEKAHLLNQEAQSAFLKMLEEPRGKTVFILLSEYPEMLLPTILSRVERLRFYSPPEREHNAEEKKAIGEIVKLDKEDLFARFKYAKALAEEPAFKETLDTWLGYFREMMLLAVSGQAQNYSLAKLKRILKTLQNISFLISTTNVNTRLALEILMLEL